MIDDEFFGPAIVPRSPKQPGTAYGGKRNTLKNNSNNNNAGAESTGSRVVSGGRNRNNDTESQYQPIHVSIAQFQEPQDLKIPPHSPNNSQMD
jgi:hypothetical protein